MTVTDEQRADDERIDKVAQAIGVRLIREGYVLREDDSELFADRYAGGHWQHLSVTELANAALSAPASHETQSVRDKPVEAAVPREVHEALLDSQFRAGVGAGWNAAMHPDPVESESRFADLRRIEPGALAPILKHRETEAYRPVEPEPVAVVENRFGDPEAFAERELRVIGDIQKLSSGTKLYAHPAPAREPVPADVGSAIEQFAARHAVAIWDATPAQLENAKKRIADDMLHVAIALARPYKEAAVAAREAIRREVLEEAAKIADEHAAWCRSERAGVVPSSVGPTGQVSMSIGGECAGKSIATAIRERAGR